MDTIFLSFLPFSNLQHKDCIIIIIALVTDIISPSFVVNPSFVINPSLVIGINPTLAIGSSLVIGISVVGSFGYSLVINYTSSSLIISSTF